MAVGGRLTTNTKTIMPSKLKNDQKGGKRRSPRTCSASFAGCKVGFELTKNGIPHEDAYEEPLCQSLFDVSGEGWKGNEMVGGVCGVFLIVEFDHLPTPEKMEEVRQEIIRVQNSSIGLPEVKRVKFIDLPLGTRFRYVGSNAEWVVLERHGCGKVAKWAGSDQSPVMQPICSAAESEAECQDLEVELADLEGGAQ